ncbi:hypothetical protein AC1031_013431 [Aphanomyces cochlioides]|nr:hypothetical protein AC1031_013431 [Aphanomyces cochlioides]
MGASESTPVPPGAALWKATASGDIAKVRAVLAGNTAVEVLDYIDPESNWTPLMSAASNGRYSIVALLLTHGATIDLRDTVQGNTALHLAASKNRVRVLEQLLQATCNPHVWNNDGWTALDIARMKGHREACNVLARHLCIAKGWLYMKKGHSIFYSWIKRFCVIYACTADHSCMELSIYDDAEKVKPKRVLFLTASDAATSPRRQSSRHKSKHSFSFTATTTYQNFAKETFSRSIDVRKARQIPVYNASGFRFATETLEARDRWIELLGPLAFSTAPASPMRAHDSRREDEPILEPMAEPTPLGQQMSGYFPAEAFLEPSAPPMDDATWNAMKSDLNECVICMDVARNAVCVPCGHLAGCYNCLVNVQKTSGCPICRSRIEAVVRVYTC